MNRFIKRAATQLRRLARREGGNAGVEYILVLALVGGALIAGGRGLATQIGTTFTNVTTALSTATGPTTPTP